MDDAKREALKAAGIDVEDAVRRFMGKEELMMKFLLRFGQDPNFGLLRQALEEGDTARAYEAAHTLKGVAGNLSLRVVFARSRQRPVSPLWRRATGRFWTPSDKEK